LAANYLGGFLAAVAIPSAYFQWFGRENVNLALALMFAATWSLPGSRRGGGWSRPRPSCRRPSMARSGSRIARRHGMHLLVLAGAVRASVHAERW